MVGPPSDVRDVEKIFGFLVAEPAGLSATSITTRIEPGRRRSVIVAVLHGHPKVFVPVGSTRNRRWMLADGAGNELQALRAASAASDSRGPAESTGSFPSRDGSSGTGAGFGHCCLVCGTELGNHRRRDTRTCSGKCRTRLWRMRRRTV